MGPSSVPSDLHPSSTTPHLPPSQKTVLTRSRQGPNTDRVLKGGPSSGESWGSGQETVATVFVGRE